MKKQIFKGLCTAIITPFTDGEIDYVSFKLMLERQMQAGIDAVVVLGTTGEPCTITEKEREKIIKTAVAICKGKIKVIVGCGSNNTNNAITYYNQAERLGVDGALIVTPYYNKCTQDGIVAHYAQIAHSGSLPIIIYNVPSRTGVNIDVATLKELTKINNICGIKEASGNINQLLGYFRCVGNEIPIYCGDDSLNYVYSALGASGYISVLSNIMPKVTKRIFNLCEDGKYFDANNLQLKLLPLINKLFVKVNPIPVKSALYYLGLCKNELRLPLTILPDYDFKQLKYEIDKIWTLENDCL